MEDFEIPKLDAIEIPDKTHFKIGEVAKLLDLEPYVLRYWEKEFEVLEPGKTESGQRAYQRDDIELLATIRELLYTEMFTIDGARRQLSRAKEGKPSYLSARAGEDVPADDGETEELRERNDALHDKLEGLKEERAAYADRVQALERRVEEAREAAANSADPEEVAEWKDRAQKVQAENESLRNRLAKATSKIEQLKQEKSELEREASRQEPQPEVVDALRGEVSELARLAEASSSAHKS